MRTTISIVFFAIAAMLIIDFSVEAQRYRGGGGGSFYARQQAQRQAQAAQQQQARQAQMRQQQAAMQRQQAQMRQARARQQQMMRQRQAQMQQQIQLRRQQSVQQRQQMANRQLARQQAQVQAGRQGARQQEIGRQRQSLRQQRLMRERQERLRRLERERRERRETDERQDRTERQTLASLASRAGIASNVNRPVLALRAQITNRFNNDQAPRPTSLMTAAVRQQIDARRTLLNRVQSTRPPRQAAGRLTNSRLQRARRNFNNCPEGVCRAPRCASFSPDTLVLTQRGLIRISEVMPLSDVVWSRSDETLDYGWQEINWINRGRHFEMLSISVEDVATGETSTLTASLNHRFFRQQDRNNPRSAINRDIDDWVYAEDLNIGDRLIGAGGQLITVQAIEHLAGASSLYNLSIANYHSYFVAGTSGTAAPVWVHNDSRCLPLRNAMRELPAAVQRNISSVYGHVRAGTRPSWANRDNWGKIFENRERFPSMRRGVTYREYTVPDPRAADRGRIRIIASDDGRDVYLSKNHMTTNPTRIR